MSSPEFTMRQLLEAGVHFGHQAHRWNPKMDRYIFGVRNNIHILDLSQTAPMLHRALQAISDVVSRGGRVLIVGTKRQAAEFAADAAQRSAQYYVNARWLGGMLTNWKTISNSIQRLVKLKEMLEEGAQGLTKKERLKLSHELEKLETNLGGIKDMGGIPDILFVIDTNKEAIALQEARRLNIPIAAIVDSNSDPDGIDYPIPGNDDAARAISLYCDLVARAAIDGLSRSQIELGVDMGAAEEAPPEEVLEALTEQEASAQDTPDAAEQKEAGEENKPPEAEVQEENEVKNGAPSSADDTAADSRDDLKELSGVGPVLEKKLNSLGLHSFSQIASLSAEEIARIEEELSAKGRFERDKWVEQAKALAEHKNQ